MLHFTYTASGSTTAAYYPFGMAIPSQSFALPNENDTYQNRYLYNDKEYQDDFGLNWYDYGARFYDAQIGRFHTIDWFAEDFAEWSPYHYANNNPVLNIDINGDSTFVTMSDNGTYVVTGGNLDNEDDKGVYMMGEDGQYVKVGESVTSHSFFDEDGNAVEGAVIDSNSTEGQDFIDGLIKDDPSLLVYMYYARNGQKYDLKEEDIKKRPEGMSSQQYRYRGSVTYNGEFGSARDFGNMGAGIVAGRKGLSWGASRIGFDAYQSYKSGKLDFEGIPTQKAQRIGHYIGKGLLLNEIKRKH